MLIKNKLVQLSLLLLMLGCKNVEKNVITIKENTKLLIKDIQVSTPGDVYISNNRIIIDDLFSNDYLFKVYDKSTQQKVGDFGMKGRGEKEFTSPNLILNNDNIVSLYEMGKENMVNYSLQNLLIIDDSVKKTPKLKKMLHSLCKINEDCYVGIDIVNPNNMFCLLKPNGESVEFGDFPIKEKFNNYFDCYFGSIKFHSKDSSFYYFSNVIPFVAKYQLRNGVINKVFEKTYNKYDYEIKDNKITILRDDYLLINDVHLTNSYIAKHRYSDEERVEILNNKNRINPRDYSMRPNKIYLYNFDLELCKIIELEKPIIKIGAEDNNDIIYCIGYTDDEFNLSSIELK